MTVIARQRPGTDVYGPGKGHLRFRSDVFLLVQGGVGRLFDLERAHFFGLDPLATRLFTMTLELGPEQAARTIADEYGVTESRVSSDLRMLVGQLQKQDLLEPGKSRRRGTRLAARLVQGLGELARRRNRTLPLFGSTGMVPGRFAATCLLKLAWLSLRVLGWGNAVALWHGCRARVGTLAASRREGLLEAVDQVVRAAASSQLLFPAACKERALVGAHLLRRAGLQPVIVMGVQRHPFQAHAWVECEGRIVTDDPAHCAMYTPLASYH